MSESHSGHVAHQFDSAQQQYQASTLGMWLFLVTEIMFFGGLFTGYTMYRYRFPEAFAAGSHHLDNNASTLACPARLFLVRSLFHRGFGWTTPVAF